jgi:hypothetical protein
MNVNAKKLVHLKITYLTNVVEKSKEASFILLGWNVP